MLERKPLFPGEDGEFQVWQICPSLYADLTPCPANPDVKQFSIITELLGTPADDVIQTIASENVSLALHRSLVRTRLTPTTFTSRSDPPIRSKLAEAWKSVFHPQVHQQGPAW
jgi:hypothetical protein